MYVEVIASQTSVDFCIQRRRQQRGQGAWPPQEKLAPLGGAVAMVFRNVSLAMCPLNLSLPPSPGAGTECICVLI